MRGLPPLKIELEAKKYTNIEEIIQQLNEKITEPYSNQVSIKYDIQKKTIVAKIKPDYYLRIGDSAKSLLV